MVDFSKLKRASGSSSLEKLTAELNRIASSEGGRNNDDRFWQPTTDKAGNGYAVIRFLPAPGEEDLPFVRIWSHGFKGPTGKWYIENSLTTLGKDDPVGEYNSELWNSGDEDDKKQAREQKRKLSYISNIYVVTDQGNPANEGKVFLYKYGKKIFDKINELMNPQFPGEKAINPFDLWSGADFQLKIRQVEGYRNYDKSSFSEPSALFDDDAELESIWKKEYSLAEFLKPENFKSYDELKKKLHSVLGITESSSRTESVSASSARKPTPSTVDEDETLPPPAGREKQATGFSSKKEAPPFDEGDDEGLDFFKRLASK